MQHGDVLFSVPISRLAEAIRHLPWRLPGLTAKDAPLVERGLTEVARAGAEPLEQLPGFSPPFQFSPGEWDEKEVAAAAVSEKAPMMGVGADEDAVQGALDLLVARLLRGGGRVDPLFPLGGKYVPGLGVRSRLNYGISSLPNGCRGLSEWRRSYWRRSTLAAIYARGATAATHWAIHLRGSEAAAFCPGWPISQGALLVSGSFGRRWAPFKEEPQNASTLADMAAGAVIWPPLPGKTGNEISRPDPDLEAKVIYHWTKIPNLVAKASMEPAPLLMDRVDWPR